MLPLKNLRFVSILVLGIILAYVIFYTVNRDQIIERNESCANPMRSPSGEMVCVPEITPPTFMERVLGEPGRPDCHQNATSAPCAIVPNDRENSE